MTEKEINDFIHQLDEESKDYEPIDRAVLFAGVIGRFFVDSDAKALAIMNYAYKAAGQNPISFDEAALGGMVFHHDLTDARRVKDATIKIQRGSAEKEVRNEA